MVLGTPAGFSALFSIFPSLEGAFILSVDGSDFKPEVRRKNLNKKLTQNLSDKSDRKQKKPRQKKKKKKIFWRNKICER